MTDVMKTELSALQGALERIDTPLRALAIAKLADMLYTPEERQKLLAMWDQMNKVDADLAATIQAGPQVDPGLSWEDRVQKYGEETAKEHFERVYSAMETRKSQGKLRNQFRSDHGLLIQLRALASELGRGKYD
ncbi:TPA: hypothetical protein L4F23_005786 [Pseudomonas aeruginosa]|nr:hypothetical protein [Pseudomonas aeruginosa]HBO1440286.1 hypothetical protein [Pseudomonas aeruginosa]HDQ9754200.1 hypothetical protein [Pseudomonas aeruginosa]